MNEKFADNEGVSIQYIILNESDDNIPLVFIPGALASADDVFIELKDYIGFYCIIISTRGSGKSGIAGKLPDAEIKIINNCGHEMFSKCLARF